MAHALAARGGARAERTFYLSMAPFIVALVGWDIYSRGRIQRATWIGGSIAFLAICVSPLIWNTPAWLAVARWLMALWG
jgi:hypothetical protein